MDNLLKRTGQFLDRYLKRTCSLSEACELLCEWAEREVIEDGDLTMDLNVTDRAILLQSVIENIADQLAPHHHLYQKGAGITSLFSSEAFREIMKSIQSYRLEARSDEEDILWWDTRGGDRGRNRV